MSESRRVPVVTAIRVREWEYGCCLCQTYHGESDGPIYREHLMRQSKHGLRRRPMGGRSADPVYVATQEALT